jgi:Mg2+ and Co2+ transporter CorA
MTDYTHLIARLRLSQTGGIHYEAADALEAQAKRIAELESKVACETASNIATAKLNGNLLERIAELEKALDAFHKDPENPDAAVLRYKAIASKAINEQVEIRKEYEACIAELEARINYIEAHVEGLVRTHSQFAAAAEGSWSGKKQRVRAAEASQILAFIRKEKSAALEKKDG